MTATTGLVVWEAIVIVAGGLVGGAAALTVMAKIPPGAWLFRWLVLAPSRQFLRSVLDTEVPEVVRLTIDRELTDRLHPMAAAIDRIDDAVNHVPPGQPTLRERVDTIDRHLPEIRGELAVIRDMVRALAERP